MCSGSQNNSRNIPEPIKREVRQRCGFGCVMCGLPVYEYDHMHGWANAQEHIAEDITLLCSNHHSQKTRGILPLADVLEANRNPYNLREGNSEQLPLHFSGTNAEVVVGTNTFMCSSPNEDFLTIPITVNNTPLIIIKIEDGNLLISMQIFDREGNRILCISDNQLAHTTGPWDIQFVGRVLTIREGERNILIEIEFLPPNRIMVNRGRFIVDGLEVIVRPDSVTTSHNNMSYAQNIVYNRPCGLKIDYDTQSLG